MAKLRHWKQRFNENAQFVWRRARLVNGRMTVVGAPVRQEELGSRPRRKLRTFWEAGLIEIAEFDPKGPRDGVRRKKVAAKKTASKKTASKKKAAGKKRAGKKVAGKKRGARRRGKKTASKKVAAAQSPEE